MTTNPNGPATDLHRIRTALTSLADALAQGRLDSLGTAEAALGAALCVQTQPAPTNLAPEERRRLLGEIEATRAALDRCRRLGASLAEFARIVLDAQGRVGAYDRTGHEAIAARVGAVDARG